MADPKDPTDEYRPQPDAPRPAPSGPGTGRYKITVEGDGQAPPLSSLHPALPPEPAGIPERRRKVLKYALALAAWGVSVALALRLGGPAPGPMPLPPASPEGAYAMGWVDDPDAVAQVRAGLPEPSFADTPAGRAVLGPDQDVLLSDAVKKVRGSHLPARDQNPIGSCTSFGTTSAGEYLIYAQIAAGKPMAFRDLATEPLYALGRVDVGGGQLRGRDGGTAAWMGKAARDFGLVPRAAYPGIDLSAYSPRRCREWGDAGCPPGIKDVARQSPVKGISLARSATEVASAIRQGYTVSVGSNVGFGPTGGNRRDADGFLRESGSWSHCMAVIGVRAGNRPGFLVLNSWGPNWVSGPTGGFDIPPGSFFADWQTADRMFRQGDCVVLSDAVGFPAKRLDWMVMAPALQRDEPAELTLAH